MLKALKRGSAAIFASIALLLSTVLAANALTYSPDPVQENKAIHVVSTSTNLPAGHYKVSVCTTKKYGPFKAEWVPACAKGTDIPDFKGGQLSATIPAVKRVGNENAHPSWLPGQPKTFSCSKPGDCEILIVKHVWGFHQTLERASITIDR